jgi:hypothetical protein
MVECIMQYLKDIKYFDNFKDRNEYLLVFDPSDQIRTAANSASCSKYQPRRSFGSYLSNSYVIGIAFILFLLKVIIVIVRIIKARRNITDTSSTRNLVLAAENA